MRLDWLVLGSVLSVSAYAQGDDLRAKLEGKWQQQGDSASSTVWEIHQKPNAVHIVRVQGDKPAADYECNTLGKDCNVKDSGHSVTVSLYFNGPRLVEFETRGKETVKRRFLANGDDGMDMDVIPVVPEGKTETVHFKRVTETKP